MQTGKFLKRPRHTITDEVYLRSGQKEKTSPSPDMYKTDSQWLKNSKRMKAPFNYRTLDTRCLFTDEAAALVAGVPGPDKYCSKSNLELVYPKVRAASITKSHFPRGTYG